MADNNTNERWQNSLYRKITQDLIDDIKNNNAPWQKPFGEREVLPVYNPASKNGNIYGAFNRLLLAQNEFSDPRYVTVNQANKMEWRIKKGSQGSKVVNFPDYQRVPQYDPRTGEVVKDANGREKIAFHRPAHRFMEVHTVFNASQLVNANGEEIPPIESSTADIDRNYEKLDALLNTACQFDKNLTAEHGDGIEKAYSDAIRKIAANVHNFMIERGDANSFHEAQLVMTEEIAAWLICQDLGICFEPSEQDNRNLWVMLLEADTGPTQYYILADICKQADKIKSNVLNLEQFYENVSEGKAYATNIYDLGKLQIWQMANPDIQIEVALKDGKITADQDVYLGKAFEHRHILKNIAGAEFDRAKGEWFLHAGQDLREVSRFLPMPKLEMGKTVLTPEEEFKAFLISKEFEMGDQQVIIDGENHYVPVKGGTEKDGVYNSGITKKVPHLLFNNIVKAWKGLVEYSGGELTETELNRVKDNAAKVSKIDKNNKALEQAQNAVAASNKYENAQPAANNHAFYVAHELTTIPHEVYRLDANGDLMVPRVELENNAEENRLDFKFTTMQHLGGYGDGYSEKGCKKSGTMTVLDTGTGVFAAKHADTILMAQSLESGMVLKSISYAPVLVYYEPTNLRHVAEAVRANYPEAHLCICPDKNREPGVDYNIQKANDVAEEFNATVIVPPQTQDQDKKLIRTFNDLRQSRGIEDFRGYVNLSVANSKSSLKDGGHER